MCERFSQCCSMFSCRIFMSLPVYSQHLLVLLFGTFRVIHSNSERAKTGMTAEALGVSVAPSFFHTCVSEGKIAKPEEVNKFKVKNNRLTNEIKIRMKKHCLPSYNTLFWAISHRETEGGSGKNPSKFLKKKPQANLFQN